MLEIFLILVGILIPLGAAKRGRGRRRSFNLRRVRIRTNGAIGALAAADVVSFAMHPAGVGTMRVMSIKLNWAVINLAAIADGSFEFGVAHSDYSAAEIEESLEASGAIDVGDKVAQEQSNRLVRTIGTINSAGEATVNGEISFLGGRPVKTRLNWLLSIGDTLHAWVRNSSGVIYTTGSSLGWGGEMWVKDSV